MRPDPATLNAVQQTLRGLTVSLATAARADLGELATLLQAFASGPGIEATAQSMLLDLAEGLQLLHGKRPH